MESISAPGTFRQGRATDGCHRLALPDRHIDAPDRGDAEYSWEYQFCRADRGAPGDQRGCSPHCKGNEDQRPGHLPPPEDPSNRLLHRLRAGVPQGGPEGSAGTFPCVLCSFDSSSRSNASDSGVTQYSSPSSGRVASLGGDFVPEAVKVKPRPAFGGESTT